MADSYDSSASTTPSLDAYAHSHLVYAPGIMRGRIDRFHPTPRRILDFGCGLGYMSLALARAYPDCDVLGVDVHDNFANLAAFSQRVLNAPPPGNLRFAEISPGQSVVPMMTPDVILSWSVMEHVNRAILPAVLADLHATLAPGGILFTQICPLFFSPFGSHLESVLDEPWAHLTLAHDDLRRRVVPDLSVPAENENGPWRFAHYEELNRITAEELAIYAADAGFDALEDTRLLMPQVPPAHLLTAYPRAVLLNHELIFVHRKGVAGQRGRRIAVRSNILRRMIAGPARRLLARHGGANPAG